MNVKRVLFQVVTAALLGLAMQVGGAEAAVYQYKLSTTTKDNKPTDIFLWVPADAKQVRGILVAGMTVMEKEFCKDPQVRKACAAEGIAIVFMRNGLLNIDLDQTLKNLANESGYKELAVAPLFFVGHSAGGPQAHDLAVKYADRCFGVMQYRGGGPADGTPVPSGIPALAMPGQFDEYNGVMRREGGKDAWVNFAERLGEFRSKDEARLASIAVEPGAGHFAWSDRNGVYFAKFIQKAAKARIPATWAIDANKPPELLAIDPKSGWLTSFNLREPEAKPAAYNDYTGDKTRAAWHFDKEMAEATAAYHQGFDKKDQFIKWKDQVWVDAGTRHFFLNLKWVGDGQTFEVSPVYSETYPQQFEGKGPKWLQAGLPVGKSKAPIKVKNVAGPLVVAGDNQFRVQFDNVSPAADGLRGTNFMAYSEGDAEYRYTEQVGMTNRGFSRLNDGKANDITFDALPDMKVGDGPVALRAASSADLPVEFYVAAGPAEVIDGKLTLKEVPSRATFPMTITVVAYQFGRGVEPKVKTATPVEQRFKLHAK